MLYQREDKILKKYDAIVIGGGIGGLTIANKLAKENLSVLLLESHNKLGGLATWFRRKIWDDKKENIVGHHWFDVSLHGFPYGMIKACRKYWSKNIADQIIKLPVVKYINPQFSLETDFSKTDFMRILVEKFELDKEVVFSFFDRLENMNFYDDQTVTNAQLFEEFFPGRNDVVRFLLEPIAYANGSTLDDPAITYGIVFSNFMNRGVYTFKGGTDVMINMMKDELLLNGVDIKTNSLVEKILLDADGRMAKGVLLKNGESVFAQSIISNANIKYTIENLLPKESVTEKLTAGLNATVLNTSSCQVYIGIKKGETIPHVGDLIFTSTASEFSIESLLSSNVYSQTFSFYYPEIRPQLENQYAIVSSSNALYSDWENLSDEEYKLKKNFLIERALIELDKIVPNIKSKIDYIDAATPLTIKRYTHHPLGTSFGTKFKGLKLSEDLPREIPGLFHTGSVGIIMSGWLGALNYGIIVAANVVNYLETKGVGKNEI